MTIRFASARNVTSSPFARVLFQGRALDAVNDNSAGEGQTAMLAETLRHFARHGLGAAREARHRAEDAWLAGERAEYDHWLGICRMLDRRMASRASLAMEHCGEAR